MGIWLNRLKKAFDCVHWIKLLEMLRNIGVTWKERRIICDLYTGQKVNLRLNQGKAASVKTGE